MESGSVRKYLLYAIGEILLVMIGILLALQVNNWNEERKLIKSERVLLAGIKEDVQRNIENLEEAMSIQKDHLNSGDIILKALEFRTPYHDSLDIHFSKMGRIGTISLSSASFETLKSEGVGIIRDEKLRKMIIELFENEFPKIDGTQFISTGSVMLPEALVQRFRWGFGLGTPNDYTALLDDEEFKNLVFYTLNIRNNFLGVSEEVIVNSNYVSEQIDGYLGK